MSEEVVWSTCENNSTSVHHRNLSYIYLSVPPLAATEHSALEMIDEVLNENRKFFNSPFTIPLASQEEDDGAHHHDDDEDVQNPLTVGAMRARRQHSGSLNANRHHDGDRGDEGRNRRDSAYSVDEQNFRDFDYDQRDIRRQAQSNAPPGDDDDGVNDADASRNPGGMKVGFYQISNKQLVRFVYIPKATLRSANFNFDDAFAALKMPTPDLIFELNSAADTSEWNLRLPEDKLSLRVNENYDPDSLPKAPSQLANTKPHQHYQGVVRENCKRLLRATSAACSQAGAVFTTRCTWDMKPDCVAEWIADSGDVPILLVAGRDSFHPDYYKCMTGEAYTQRRKSDDLAVNKVTTDQYLSSTKYDSNESADDTNKMIEDRIRMDKKEWVVRDSDSDVKPLKVPRDNNGKFSKGLPHPFGSHLIISDDLKMLEEKLERRIPTGYIIINGRATATQKFCEAVQMGKPVFVFKHTGNAADLICETLKKANEYVQKRRVNQRAKPVKPFPISLPDNYTSDRYIWPYDEKMLKSCMTLNIFMDNFPANYNPLSVLAIDMFTMTEERLQDQLTKTMSVAFEGMVEMGGAALEARRLTYAWRLRHLLDYNSGRQKRFSDLLQSLCILFSALSTFAAVIYGYLLYIGTIHETKENLGQNLAQGYGLVALNLLLPLAVTVLRGMIASLNPLSKYAVLKGTAIKVESEIYLYRTKCGKYNMRKTAAQAPSGAKRGGDKDDASSGNKKDEEQRNNPRKVFSSSLDQIWLELASSDIAKGSMMTPPDHCDPLDSVNAMLKSNIRQQRLLTQSLRQNGLKKKATVNPFVFVHEMLFSSDRKKLSDLKKDADRRFRNGGPGIDSPKLSNMPGESKEGDSDGDNKSQSGDSARGSERDEEDEAEMSAIAALKEKESHQTGGFVHGEDDGVSMLTADEYITLRLTPQLARFMVDTPSLHRLTSSVTALIIFFSVFSSILSTFGYIQFIPAMFAISGAATAWTSYSQTDLVLVQTNAAINQLNQLVIWWDALSMIEKRIGANKEFLVMITETAIQGQVVGYATKTRQKDEDNDDDAK